MAETRVRKQRQAGFLWLALLCLLLLALLSFAYATSPASWFGSDLEDLVHGWPVAALWLAILLLTALFSLFVGWYYATRWSGVLINRYNRYSLSQLQFVLWTLLIVSSAMAFFLVRLRAGPLGAGLNFDVPPELAGIFAISSVSAGATMTIQGVKKAKDATTSAVERSCRAALKQEGADYLNEWAGADDAKRASVDLQKLPGLVAGRSLRQPLLKPKEDGALDAATKKGLLAVAEKQKLPSAEGEPALNANELEFLNWLWARVGVVEVDGVMQRNKSPQDAAWRDLIEGDEIGNARSFDLGKLQMLLFTAVIFGAYVAMLVQFFSLGTFAATDCAANVNCLGSLPPVSDGLIGVLGASHLGYLGTKAAGSTRSV
jgi:hypothetical protein